MKYLTFLILLPILISCSTENWESLRTKTEEAFNNGNYAQAIEYLEEAISNEPQNAEAHYYLGQAYRLMVFKDGSMLNKVTTPLTLKSSEHFRKATEITPKYTGKKFVVDPYSKIQSIWGALAMTFLYNNNPDSAKWAFEYGQSEGGFYPAMMEFNKNIMASCEKNAILFTNGDNDTFPMWFLQLVEKYRTDITVINLSLLNVSWYIQQLKNSYPFGENNLFVNLTDADIDSLRPIYWEDGKVTIPVKHDPLNKEGKIEWRVKPTVENKAIRVQDIMLMDIIRANDWNRPIYFTTTVSEGNRIGLDNFLAPEGLVGRLCSHECKVSPEKIYSNLAEVYTYDGVNDKHINDVEEVASMYQNYRHAFIHLVWQYEDAGEKKRAVETLNLMDEKLPETLLPYSNEDMEKEAERLRSKYL
jgi:tetratricopeptide (TPR) repeat protein